MAEDDTGEQPGDDRLNVNLRLRRSSLAWADEKAQARDTSRAVILREIMALGRVEYERRERAGKRQVKTLPKGRDPK
jgi:hypothetical protein